MKYISLLVYDAVSWTCFINNSNGFVSTSSEWYGWKGWWWGYTFRWSGSPREKSSWEEVEGCCVVIVFGLAFKLDCRACIRILKITFWISCFAIKSLLLSSQKPPSIPSFSAERIDFVGHTFTNGNNQLRNCSSSKDFLALINGPAAALDISTSFNLVLHFGKSFFNLFQCFSTVFPVYRFSCLDISFQSLFFNFFFLNSSSCLLHKQGWIFTGFDNVS